MVAKKALATDSQKSPQALALSIVIPVYNDERYFRDCLDSIAAQTTLPAEVIVVDNNCTDSSMHIAAQYSFVKIIKAKRQGIVYARNAGFSSVKTELTGRIDADSVLPKNWVKDVMNFYAKPQNYKSALTGGGYPYNITASRIFGWFQSQVAFRFNKFILGHHILWGSNMVIPSYMWEKVTTEVCERDDIHEDIDLAIHLHRAGYAISYQPLLNVGVEFKRVVENRAQLPAHMRRWPRALRVHGYPLWWLGSIGNTCLLLICPIFIYGGEAYGKVKNLAYSAD